MTTQPAAPQAPVKQKSSCWLVGGVTCLVIAIVGLVLLIVIGWWVSRGLTAMLDQWTDTEPMALPASELSQDQVEQVMARVKEFNEAMASGGEAEPLRLSGPEINALIQNHPDLEALRGAAHVTVENGQIRGQISMPLDWFPGAGGRYLNGSAAFEVFMRNDALFVQIQDLEVRGEQLPEEFMQQLRRENLAKDIYQDPNLGPLLSRMESIEVEGDELVIVPKPAAERSGAAGAAA